QWPRKNSSTRGPASTSEPRLRGAPVESGRVKSGTRSPTSGITAFLQRRMWGEFRPRIQPLATARRTLPDLDRSTTDSVPIRHSSRSSLSESGDPLRSSRNRKARINMKKTYVAWPILIGGAVVVAALSVSASLAAHATAPAPSPLRGGVTSLRFNAEILANLGIELVDVAETSAPLRHGALGFALDIPGSTVALDGVGGAVAGFAATDLRHAGGFALRVDGVRVDLAGFRLTSTASRYTLELRDAQGRRWLFVDKPHAVLAPDGLPISNAALGMAPHSP